MGYDIIKIDAITGKRTGYSGYMTYNFSDEKFSRYWSVKKNVHMQHTKTVIKTSIGAIQRLKDDGYIMGICDPKNSNWGWGFWEGSTDADNFGIFMWHIQKFIDQYINKKDGYLIADIKQEFDDDGSTRVYKFDGTVTSINKIRTKYKLDNDIPDSDSDSDSESKY